MSSSTPSSSSMLVTCWSKLAPHATLLISNSDSKLFGNGPGRYIFPLCFTSVHLLFLKSTLFVSGSNIDLDLASSTSVISCILFFSSSFIMDSNSTSCSNPLSLRAHLSFTNTFSISKINLSLSSTLLIVNLGPLVRVATSSSSRSFGSSPTITGPLTSPGMNVSASPSLKTLASLYLARREGSSNFLSSFQFILIVLIFLWLFFFSFFLSLVTFSLTQLMCLL